MSVSAELECGICLTLPLGEVHQCHEGHCYCVDCWDRLPDPRRCPECRQPVAQANRSRAAERAIAALEASCEHCNLATTRGAMAAHLRVCTQRPAACAAAAAGCSWAGVASEQTAHEAACPFAICQRMMAPLQAQNQQLQSECQELRARVAVVEPLQARCDGLQVQNQQLHRQVAALQPPPADRMRALEGDEEAGGRRRRQRVGPAPHLVGFQGVLSAALGASPPSAVGPAPHPTPHHAPPSDEELEAMGLAEVVAALRAHVAVAWVVERACLRIRVLCEPEGSELAAAEAGVIEAVVEAMQAHPHLAVLQEQGCAALGDVCYGNDAAGLARSQRAAEAGAIEAVVDAMRAHLQDGDVQEFGCCALLNMTFCSSLVFLDNEAGEARRLRASQAGGRAAAVAAMHAHPENGEVERFAEELLMQL